jgi:hypothetical protein
VPAGGINAAADCRRFGALIGRGAADGASAAARGGLILLKIAVARVVLDPDAETAFDVNIIGGAVARIRTSQSAAGQTGFRRALHMLVAGARRRPARGLGRVALIGSQTGSPFLPSAVLSHVANHFISIWHSDTPSGFLKASSVAHHAQSATAIPPALRKTI